MTEEEFTGFKRKHYRVTSGLCLDACVAYRTLKNEVAGKHFDFAQSVGGVGYYAGWDENVGNATAISAVIFDGDLPAAWKARRWSSFKNLKRGHTAGFPDKRSKAGKALLAQIEALPQNPSADRICGAIGFPLSIDYEREGDAGTEHLGFLWPASVGWIKDTFYLSLPDYAAQRAKKEEDGYTVTTPPWFALEGMEPVLKEEVDLDFARAALISTGGQ